MDDTYHDYTYAEALAQKIKGIFDIVHKWIEQFIEPTVKALVEWAQKFSDWLYQIYLENGAVYGESQEGSSRWYRNLVKENAKCQELEARGMGYGQEVPLDYLLFLNNKLKRRLN